MRATSDGERRWTCTFTPPSSCSHDARFTESYQRTNRMNRTKIMRCFPHCCPDHRTRSYCCTSVQLTVTAPTEAPENLGLQVFARFRGVDDEVIHEHDLLPAASIHSSLQSAEQPTASWVSSRVIFRLRNVVGFEINPEAHWLYLWSSGATMTQRLTRHLLEAIVVLPCRDNYALKIVAVALSLSFTFSSFRHAIHGESASREPSFLYRALSHEFQVSSRTDGDVAANSTVLPNEPSEENMPTEDHEIICAPSNRGFVSMLDWVAPLAASHVAHSVPHRQTNDQPAPPISREDPLSMATHLTWWIFTDSDVRQELDVHSQSATRDLGDPEALRRAYVEWSNHLERRCDGFLATFGSSWRALIFEAASNHSFVDVGVHWFIAVVRHHAVDQARLRRALPTAISEEVWTCDPTAVQARRLENAHMMPCELLEVLTIGPLVLLWSQLSSFRIGFDSHSSCLSIQSTKARTGLELLLDHKYRCFETLPNGLPPLTSSLLTAYELGDYIGFAATTHRLHVTLFAWPRDAQSCAYRWHWTLRLPTDASAPLLLNVRVDIGDLTRRQTDTPSPMETLRLSDKLALVDRWIATYEALVPYHRGSCQVYE